jgi:tetratricopeptide (TPR) repeat protein
MTFSLSRLLFSFCFVAAIYSCNKITNTSDIIALDNASIDSLISRGKKYQSAHSDSLFAVAKKLLKTATSTGNKTALVYGEQFMANYYWLSADYKKSMKIAVQCLVDAEKWNITKPLPDIYFIIGNLHKENANYKMAFDAGEKGLNWAKANQDTTALILLLNLKAVFIHTSRDLPHDASYKDTSINIQLATLKIAESNIKYERLCIHIYNNISQYYLNKKEYDQAIFYGNKGALTALKYDQSRSLTNSYSWLGEAWYFKGDRPKGLNYLNNALLITRSLKEPYREMEIYEHLYDCYYSSGDYKTAIALSERSHTMRDSLKNLNNEKQISELQIRYETNKKDKEIALREWLIMAILGCSLVAVIFSVTLYFRYRKQSENNRLIIQSNAQKDKALENIAFIQTHELRKPVASILGLINLIKVMNHEFDEECILKLEEAGKELDTKIRSIISYVEVDEV